MKMIKPLKVLILLLVCFQILTANDIEELGKQSLKQYITMLSDDLGMTFVYSDEIKEDFTLIVPYDVDLSGSDKLKILVQVLNFNDLTIEPNSSFFVISKNKEETKENKELQFIILKNVDYDTIKPLFKTINDISHSYISSNKTIAFKSTKKKFTRISKLIQQLDKTPKQLKLKVTIVDTNLDKLKDYGTELKQLNTFTADNNYFFNLLAYPFQVSSEIDETKTKQLHSFIHFMDTNELTKIKSSPTVTLFDNKETKFDVVKNIPYTTGTTSINSDNSVSTTSTTKYKDVGLKLSVLPRIYNKNVFLDLELTIENLLGSSDTPTTSKNFLKQTFSLTKNKVYALTGINQQQSLKTVNSTPYLSDIPFLGWLFKLDNQSEVNSNLTIFLELIDDEKIIVENDTFKINLKQMKTKNNHEKMLNDVFGLNYKKD